MSDQRKRRPEISEACCQQPRATATRAAREGSSARGSPGQQHALHAQQLPHARGKRAVCAVAGSCSTRPAAVACNQQREQGLPVARASVDVFRCDDGSKSASEMREQSLPFVEMAAGEDERKKNMILGFHGFYHGDPYSFISFLLGRNVSIFCV